MGTVTYLSHYVIALSAAKLACPERSRTGGNLRRSITQTAKKENFSRPHIAFTCALTGEPFLSLVPTAPNHYNMPLFIPEM